MKITGREIVAQFLNSSDYGSQQFMRLYNMLIWGLKTEFNLNITGTFKTVILDVNATKTVQLPCDYIQYSKIGVLNGRGEVLTFKRNEQLTTLNTGLENRTNGAPVMRGVTDILPDAFPYNINNYNNYFYGGTSYQLFGADSGTPVRGEYKVDEGQRLIFLSPQTTSDKIVLEYLSDGYEEGCDDYSVDVRAAECMKTYLRWQNAIDAVKKYSQSQIREYKSEFYRTKRITAMMMNPFILNEMQHAMRVNSKIVPKA